MVCSVVTLSLALCALAAWSRAYEQAMQLDNNNRMAAYNLGGILQDNFEEEKAIGCFNRTIQIDPDYADAHYK